MLSETTTIILAKGSPAPDFTLFDSAKNKVSLNDYKGKKVVLLFFPLAFTSVCTKELCYVRDHITLFNNIDAQVLGVSVDSLYTLAKFKEEQGLNFPLLSDFKRTVVKDYGVFNEEQGFGNRATFLIDKEGIIRHIDEGNVAIDPTTVVEACNVLQHKKAAQ